MIKIRTVRQVKQQKPRLKRNAATIGGNESSASFSSGVHQPVVPPSRQPASPPYRMPPQPPPGHPSLYGEPSIPGTATYASERPLHTHSAKYPIERELVLSAEKASTKIPLMHEPRTPAGPRRTAAGIPLLPRSTGAIAPDHPAVKMQQAWNTQQHVAVQIDAYQSPISQSLHQSLNATGSNAAVSSPTGAIPRTPARLPEDVTALAADSIGTGRDATNNKNPVAKTYHTLKDLISGKFKKDSPEHAMGTDELNNAVMQPQQQQQAPVIHQTMQQGSSVNLSHVDDDIRSPYSALPAHMRQMQGLQSQPNIWTGKSNSEQNHRIDGGGFSAGSTAAVSGVGLPRALVHMDSPRGVQQRAISQPQLNMPSFEIRDAPTSAEMAADPDRSGSTVNVEVTDSDEGGFTSRPMAATHRPHTMYKMSAAMANKNGVTNAAIAAPSLHSPHPQPGTAFPNFGQLNQPVYLQSPYQHLHSDSTFAHKQQQLLAEKQQSEMVSSLQSLSMQADTLNQQESMQTRHDALRASFQKQLADIHQQTVDSNAYQQTPTAKLVAQRNEAIRSQQQQQQQQQQHQQQQQQLQHQQQQHQMHIQPMQSDAHHKPAKPMPSSAGSSDYDKSGNHSSNVDSGRGSVAYSSGHKQAIINTDYSEVAKRLNRANNDNGNQTLTDDAEWVDIVDAELNHILEPGMQTLNLRPGSTVSESVSSMSPPLPPLSPGGSSYKPSKTKDTAKTKTMQQEYGTDSYNRPGRLNGAIGPSRAGWPGPAVQKQHQHQQQQQQHQLRQQPQHQHQITSNNRSPSKKQEQAMLKRHLFGLDNDMTSTTTRSLDLDSILGGQWGGTAQSISDSETDTQGIRHIRSQLEGLENMYGEVLRMLGSRGGTQPSRFNDSTQLRSGMAARRRHGSLSSLPSSSVSGRPIRDRRRTDDRRKVRDVKSINKRFQRLESHVVTLARSVAHLSSEMRSQHQVSQELERLRDELTALRSQSNRTQQIFQNAAHNDPEPPNLTNPRRVKKLTKFFGEDPPLMRLFLKNLGYEKYANLFEAERVGMIELPYLGEERLQKLGIPLGPRLRILQEAQISLCKDTTLCIV